MLAFIHIRKTAGSTLESILRSSFGTRHCGVRVNRRRSLYPLLTGREIKRLRWLYPRLASISGHGVTTWSDLRDHFPEIRFFTFLREPLMRCASEYQFRVMRGGMKTPFSSWIQTAQARNQQTKHLCGRENGVAAIEALENDFGFVGMVEEFSRSLVMFRRWCNQSALDIRHHPRNVAKDDSIRSELMRDLQSRRQLIEANREDLMTYAHVVARIFPRQTAEYGPRLENDVRTFDAFNYPRPTYPRELPSLALRELIYKPLAPWICDRYNPPPASWSPVREQRPRRRAA